MKILRIVGFAPVCVSLLVSSLLLAQTPEWGVIYESEFEGPAGAFPGTSTEYQDWEVSHTTTSQPPYFTLSGVGQLLMTNPEGATNSQYANAYWTGEGATITDGKITSVVQWQSNGNQSVGVMARVQNATSPDGGAFPEGYYAGILRYNPGGGNVNRLVIAKDIVFAGVTNYIIAESVNISISAGSYYRLEFEFIGDQLTASLFNTTTDSLISTITTEDLTYTSGVTGLRTNFGISNRTFGFDSVRIESAIPEPSLSILAVISLLLFFRLRHRFSKAQVS